MTLVWDQNITVEVGSKLVQKRGLSKFEEELQITRNISLLEIICIMLYPKFRFTHDVGERGKG